MRIYIYNEETKEYLYTQFAQKNPKRPTEYLTPANSTTEQLPVYDEQTETVVFNEHWEVKKDYREQEVLNLSTMVFETVDYIGDIKEGYELIDVETKNDLLEHPEAYKVIDNELVCIRGTKEFADILKAGFEKEFIPTSLGNVRIDTSWGNFLAIKPNYDIQVTNLGKLPAGVLILYKTPAFTKFDNKEDLENWLVTKGQYRNEEVSAEDYLAFSNEVQAYFVNGLN